MSRLPAQSLAQATKAPVVIVDAEAIPWLKGLTDAESSRMRRHRPLGWLGLFGVAIACLLALAAAIAVVAQIASGAAFAGLPWHRIAMGAAVAAASAFVVPALWLFTSPPGSVRTEGVLLIARGLLREIERCPWRECRVLVVSIPRPLDRQGDWRVICWILCPTGRWLCCRGDNLLATPWGDAIRSLLVSRDAHDRAQ